MDKQIENIKLPWNMPYCSLARATKHLNDSKQIQHKVLVEDFIHWEQQAYFKALIPIDSIAKNKKISFSITKQDLDDNMYVSEDAFKDYLESVRLRSITTQGYRIDTLDFFNIEPFVYPDSAKKNITGSGYIKGYVHSNSYILNSLPTNVLDLHVEILIEQAKMQMRVDLDYFRWDGESDPDLNIFKSDWLNKVMISEKELNRLHDHLVKVQSCNVELKDEIKIETTHGNSIVNQQKNDQILTYAKELIKTYPTKCKSYNAITRLMFTNPSKHWKSGTPPRSERHISSLLSKNNLLG